MSDETPSESDSYLEHLKSGRHSPAVLKIKLIQLKADAPGVVVLVFEGDDDKVIYSQWIRRIRPDLQYEPFPCNGKDGVLTLLDAVLRDRGDLAKNVFFFIDRDYDDLRDVDPPECIFMTDRYSVENYLVTNEVLLELLKNEFHCHTKLDVRESVKDVFVRTYGEFLKVTREINRRIYVARKLRLKLKHALPTGVNAIARIELARVSKPAKAPEEIVVYFQTPDLSALALLNQEFNTLDPFTRYRGKFALSFFQRWLSLLADEFSNSQIGLFAKIDVQSRVRTAELVLSNFASKSEFPEGLVKFVKSM
jgi:hypothetical protein